MVKVVGTNAGKVWNELELNGEMTTGALKKSLRMQPFDLNVAIGWLAREDKILMQRKGNMINVWLK